MRSFLRGFPAAGAASRPIGIGMVMGDGRRRRESCSGRGGSRQGSSSAALPKSRG
ncbi:hypothetical protein EM20IM_08220 [Candidatus Methylacidiphilum infernorum]|uniref:Uncharacterized protein n=1 Tax=Candidatus Methylacidiphilum infernorum TaxID=511746 RepID=A0ABX7PUH6_9BACT|nr:hypothetical protein [Candidatus Methylacidiphilum infernorum]QSR86470.1 hypothetical protein EM20IM_08220 [Candidatus Methylacidiphilum infernorum]